MNKRGIVWMVVELMLIRRTGSDLELNNTDLNLHNTDRAFDHEHKLNCKSSDSMNEWVWCSCWSTVAILTLTLTSSSVKYKHNNNFFDFSCQTRSKRKSKIKTSNSILRHEGTWNVLTILLGNDLNLDFWPWPCTNSRSSLRLTFNPNIRLLGLMVSFWDRGKWGNSQAWVMIQRLVSNDGNMT